MVPGLHSKGKIMKTLLMFLTIGIIGLSMEASAASTHVLGAQQQTLNPVTDTVQAGYYAATTLSAVDTDLAGNHIKAGVTIFGRLGTYAGNNLPDTGQTLCYDGAGTIITCPAHGGPSEQDGSYSAYMPSYTDNGDFTVTDNRTGLMWKKCSKGQTNDSTCTGAASTNIWSAVLTQCTSLTNPGGYTDWRLPNVRELMSIVDYSVGSPSIYAAHFPNTVASYYWTSTSYVSDPSAAWRVLFSYGQVSNFSKTTNHYVRCIRGGP